MKRTMIHVAALAAMLLALVGVAPARAAAQIVGAAVDVGGPLALASAANDSPHAESGGAPSGQISPRTILNADGTLDLASGLAGSVALSGWDVRLDSDLGPVFSPQAGQPATPIPSAPSPGDWANLESGGSNINSLVQAVEIIGTDVYVGGYFVDAGDLPAADYVAKWDGSDWSALGARNTGDGALVGTVTSLATDGSNLYVGGWFGTAYNGATSVHASKVAMWDGANWSALGSDGGTGSSINPSGSFAVFALAVDSSGNVYAGGNFTDVNNNGTLLTAADYVAMWDGTDWSSLSSDGGGPAQGSLNAIVYDMAVDSSDNVYVGGNFVDVSNGGAVLGAADYIAMWDGTDWSALGNNGGGGGSLLGTVNAVAVSGTDVFVGGNFTNVNNGGATLTAADYIAKWDGSDWSALGSDGSTGGSLNNSVQEIAVSGSDVYVVGSFVDVNNGGTAIPEADRVAKWNTATSQWSALGGDGGGDGSLGATVYAVGVSGSNVYVGGNFAGLVNSGTPIPQAAYAAYFDGSDWAALGDAQGSIGNKVQAIAISGTDIYVGGSFKDVSNHDGVVTAADYIAKWDGTRWSALGGDDVGNGALNGGVTAIAISGSDVYVGGNFTWAYNGAVQVPEARSVARWDGANWSALGDNGGGGGSLNAAVWALAANGSTVYAGGSFTDVQNGLTTLDAADYIAKWDGSDWSALGDDGGTGGSLNAPVYALALDGSRLYAGGLFTDVQNGITPLNAADYIAKWDGADWSALGDDGTGQGCLSGQVNAIVVSGASVYAGGNFTNVKSAGVLMSEADFVAKWNSITGDWSALASSGSTSGALTGAVNALAIRGQNLYVGGGFSNANNNGTAVPEADYVARWDGSTWSALGDNGGGDGAIPPTGAVTVVNALAAAADTLYVGGYFFNVNNNGAPLPYADYIAGYGITPLSAAPADFDGNGTSDTVVFSGGAWQFYDFDTGLYDHGTWTGNPGSCIPAPMDYDGDGSTDFTLLCGPVWHFFNDDGSYNKGVWTGLASAVPVPADYDGDGTDDPVAFDGGAWQHYDFATGLYDAAHSVWTGLPGGAGVPAVMDYDGDGSAELTILADSGAWHFYSDDGSYNKGIWVGIGGAVPVPADYSGNGTEQPVVFAGGAWQFYDFATGLYDGAGSVWTGAPAADGSGIAGAAPLDYDGDGMLDFTYYAGGAWHFYNANGSYNEGVWTGGIAGDEAISRRQLP